MATSFVFDLPESVRFVTARQAFLKQFLSRLQPASGLRTALDVGCGVGYFAAFLQQRGFQVTAIDGRQENLEEARRRHPQIDFRLGDVEELPATELGVFDLVLCFGLLYHLENPLRALRRLRAVTGRVLLIESVCVPGTLPVLYLRDEMAIEDQALNAVAACPSEGALFKMAYRAGFPAVYRVNRMPEHEEFRDVLGRARRRTIIAAAASLLEHPMLAPAAEPSGRSDLWTTDPTRILKMSRKLRAFLKRPWAEQWARLRRRYGPG